MSNEKKQNSSQEGQHVMPPYAYYSQINAMGEDEINLMDYWRVLVKYKWLIVLVTSFFTVISIVVALLMTPIYRAEILLAPIVEEKSGAASALGQFGGLASMAGVNLGGNESTEQSLAVLKSRNFLDKFIKEEKLLPILFFDMWNKSTGSWLVESEENIPSMWDAYKLFSKTVLMSDIDVDSGLVTVSVEWKDPKLAAEWTNKLISRLNQQLRTTAVSEAANSINYLQEQLQQTSVVDMHQVLYRLIESETQKIMLAKVRDQYAFKVIDPAVAPEEKVKPKRSFIVLVGFLSGFIFSIFLSFLLSFISKQHEVERLSKNKIKN